MSGLKRQGSIMLVLFIGVLAPWFLSSYQLYNVTLVLVYAIAILGINLLTGYTGQMSVATSVFVAVGAYTTAILTVDYGVHFVLTIPIGVVLAFVGGYLLGLPALRLKGFYLMMITLALAVALPPILKRFDDLTHGAGGIVVRRPKAPDWLPLEHADFRYFIVLSGAVIAIAAAQGIASGIVGKSLIAVRDNEIVAEGLGIDLARHKLVVFAYSSALAGLAGSLYALNVGVVAPDSFSLFLSIFLLAAAVVGGISTIAGALLGAAFYVFVPIYAGEVNQGLVGILFGVAIILTMIRIPRGLAGVLEFARSRKLAVLIRFSPKRPGNRKASESKT